MFAFEILVRPILEIHRGGSAEVVPMVKSWKNRKNCLQLLNGWESPPQTYTHLKEDVQGFQNPVSDFPESARVSRKVGFSDGWGQISGVKSSKTAYLKNRFFAHNFHQTQKFEKVCIFF